MLLSLIKLFLHLMAMLPLRANHAVGAFLGWLVWIVPNRNRANTLVNLRLCYPDMPKSERRRLARRSLQETGKAASELGWLWYRPPEQVAALLDFADQQQAFAGLPRKRLSPAESNAVDNAPTNIPDTVSCGQKRNTGVDTRALLITPHFGAWEACPAALAVLKDPVFLYRPPRALKFEPLIKAGRERFGGELTALDSAGLKSLLRSLRQGRPIGILPDQEPDPENGVFADFLGVPANTMTMLPRLAGKSGAQLICLAIQRKSKGRGYRVHQVAVDAEALDPDLKIATAALNRTVERCVEIDPAQYCWS